MKLLRCFILVLLVAPLPVAADPGNANSYIQDAMARQQHGDFPGMIIDYDQAIQLDPNFAPFYNDRGAAKLQSGDVAGAIADFSEAVQIDPNYAMAYRNRGGAYERNGAFSAAADDFNRAIALKLTDEGTYANIGNLERQEGKFDAALKDYDHAIDLTTKHTTQQAFAYMGRGSVKMEKGDIAGGLADFQQADASYPNLPIVQYRIGTARQAQGDLKGAIAQYDLVLEVAHKYADVYASRGVAKAVQGDYAGALADLGQYQALAPQKLGRTPFLIWVIRAQVNLKADADRELIAYLASQPSGWNSKIGEMLIGQITERDFLAQAASVVNPSMAELQQKEAWYYAGMKRLLAGDKTAAVDDFRKCVSIQNRLEPEDSLAVAELVKLGVGE